MSEQRNTFKEQPLSGSERLLKRPIPDISDTLLKPYTGELLRERRMGLFDPVAALEKLRALAGKDQRAIVADMGGNKTTIGDVTVGSDGRIKSITPLATETNTNGGENCITTLRSYSNPRTERVGISTAGIVDGTLLIDSPNLPALVQGLSAYTSEGRPDLAALFPGKTVAVANDGIAGLVAATVEAVSRASEDKPVKKVIYLINGGGVGGAVWDGELRAYEPGHISADPRLNLFGQEEPCGMEGSRFVCVERIGASGAGVQSIYAKRTGNHLSGEEISLRYQEGEILAGELYNISARITALSILGLDKASAPEGVGFDPDSTVIVCHGGIFNVPGYGERVEQILEKKLGTKPRILYTKDFTQETTGNACLDGAAILAFTSNPHSQE